MVIVMKIVNLLEIENKDIYLEKLKDGEIIDEY